MLTAAIRLYQRNRLVNHLTRRAVGVHHAVRKPETKPCPYAGRCSEVGLTQARVLGMAALPLILSRMASCGPSVDRAEWCIRAPGISDYCESFDPKS